MDCSPPCSSVHGIFQARVLKWVATSFSRGYSRPRNRTQVTCIVSKTLYRLSHQGSLCCWYLILNSHFIHFCFIYSVLLIYISLGQCSMLIKTNNTCPPPITSLFVFFWVFSVKKDVLRMVGRNIMMKDTTPKITEGFA